MNQHLNPSKIGLATGAILGGLHALWSILVALGWAQTLIDFSLHLHMISVPIVVEPFDSISALTLVIIATIAGYVAGYVCALIWNRIFRA